MRPSKSWPVSGSAVADHARPGEKTLPDRAWPHRPAAPVSTSIPAARSMAKPCPATRGSLSSMQDTTRATPASISACGTGWRFSVMGAGLQRDIGGSARALAPACASACVSAWGRPPGRSSHARRSVVSAQSHSPRQGWARRCPCPRRPSDRASAMYRVSSAVTRLQAAPASGSGRSSLTNLSKSSAAWKFL